jgi:WD40 repeat protein
VGNKFMIGGASKSLKLLDLRMFDSNEQKPIVWKHDNAHAATIRDIKWNPFVPHWVASCGDDCDIHIWDLRFGKQPVLTLQDHSNAINKVSLHPIHTHTDSF